MSAIRSVISSQPPVPGKFHSRTPALLSGEVQENIVLLLPCFCREDTEVLGLEENMGNQDPRCHETLVELRGSSELSVTSAAGEDTRQPQLCPVPELLWPGSHIAVSFEKPFIDKAAHADPTSLFLGRHQTVLSKVSRRQKASKIMRVSTTLHFV